MIRLKAFVTFLLISAFCTAQAAKPSLTQTQVEAGNPVADPRSVVVNGNARFTVLTSQLVRMEWSQNAAFEDHASLMFINRRLPVPQFTKKIEDGWLVIATSALTLRYRE